VNSRFFWAVALLAACIAPIGAEVSDIRIYPNALLARNGNGEYRSLPIRDVTGPNTYLNSVSRSPWDDRRLIVATTFHGLYESTDGGDSWIELSDRGEVRDLYKGNGFYEDIAAAAYDPDDRDRLWVELAHDGSYGLIDRRTGAFTPVSDPRARTILARALRTPEPNHEPLDAASRARQELAAGHSSFYLSPWQMSAERLEAHMEMARRHRFTAVVVDFKDDLGRIAYNSALEPHRSIGAVRSIFNARRVIDRIHEEGLYLIARVVVFKDRELFSYDGHRYAVWDHRNGAPWGVFREYTDEESGETRVEQVEHWVDPFSEFVWEYNIAIARELEALGVDEIQFDYIRTPADGRTWDIRYRFKETSPALVNDDPFTDDRVEALSTFLRRAREEISIPIGIDVFGFNAWYRMSYLGQDIAALSRYVDVISPMLYPSHFPRDFVGDLSYLPWAEFLYRDGVARARRITGDRVLIRPYIQSFLIGGELNFEEPVYTDYLKHQIRGAQDGGASGFTLWNFSGRYYMLSRGLYF
jgi:hypothetical protein